MKHQTLTPIPNPQTQTSNSKSKPQTPNPKPQTPNPKHKPPILNFPQVTAAAAAPAAKAAELSFTQPQTYQDPGRPNLLMQIVIFPRKFVREWTLSRTILI